MNGRIATIFSDSISKLKNIDLMDIIKSIIIPVLVAYGVAGYQIDHQATLDKQDAAKQMLIEINSSNDTLQKYADMYNRNLDLLNSNGENPKVIPNINNSFLINDNNNGQLKLIWQIVNNKPSFGKIYINSIHNGNYNETWDGVSGVFNTVNLDTIIVPPPLYSDHGMYYLYTKEISNFDLNDTKDIYTFYNELTKAESDRNYLQTYFDTHANTSKLNEQQFNTYMDMRLNIVKAAANEDNVSRDLDNEIKEKKKFIWF